ncbi:MAG: hypothetical protein ACR2PG_19470 [Hyphomicrobiaceae bacterium]
MRSDSSFLEFAPLPRDVLDERNSILAEIDRRIDELDALADAADQQIARLFYRWGSAKYRSYSDRFDRARNCSEQNEVLAEMQNLCEAVWLAETCDRDPLTVPELEDIKEAAKNAELYGVAQDTLRGDLSLLLVRNVHQIIQETERHLSNFEGSLNNRLAREEVRLIFRWHCKLVLDLLELLPGSDVVKVTDEIGRSIDEIKKSTAKQMHRLTIKEFVQDEQPSLSTNVDLAA